MAKRDEDGACEMVVMGGAAVADGSDGLEEPGMDVVRLEEG